MRISIIAEEGGLYDMPWSSFYGVPNFHYSRTNIAGHDYWSDRSAPFDVPTVTPWPAYRREVPPGLNCAKTWLRLQAAQLCHPVR